MNRDAGALYDSLARWQWWRRRLGRAKADQGLEMRKRLVPPMHADGPDDGGAGLDRWLQAKVAARPHQRVLDLGCGFGISLLRWLRHGSERAHGVTPSGYQVRRARQVAAAAGLADRCTFAQRALAEADADADGGDGDFDVVLAIEALGHSPDLDAVLISVRQRLRPSGVLLWVEDLLQQPQPTDADVMALAHAWRSPWLRDLDAVRASLARCSLRIVDEADLTAQVPHRSPDAIARSLARTRRLAGWLPRSSARDIADAFAGGFVLERLYARGVACYRAFVIERADAS